MYFLICACVFIGSALQLRARDYTTLNPFEPLPFSVTPDTIWSYSGFGIETHSSAEQRFVQGELQRAKKPASIRGLNRNHNHELKNLFKGAATVAAAKAGPFKEFYDALVAKGIRPEMARLTLARKMAAITLLVWKKGVRFDAQHLKPQTA